METVNINTTFIKLDQFLKLKNLCGSGGEAKNVIQSGQVYVNAKKELRRGRKLVNGDIVRFNNIEYIVRQDGGSFGNKTTLPKKLQKLS